MPSGRGGGRSRPPCALTGADTKGDEHENALRGRLNIVVRCSMRINKGRLERLQQLRVVEGRNGPKSRLTGRAALACAPICARGVGLRRRLVQQGVATGEAGDIVVIPPAQHADHGNIAARASLKYGFVATRKPLIGQR